MQYSSSNNRLNLLLAVSRVGLPLVAFTLALSCQAQAQSRSTDDYRQTVTSSARFEHITVADGLPENSVIAMLQDHLGFLWFGTQKGLVRYDGITVKTFSNSPDDPYSFGGLIAIALYEDRGGDLWIGTAASGLVHYNRANGRFRSYRNNPDDPASLSSNSVVFITEDRQGGILVVTGEERLDRLDRSTGSFTRFRHDPSRPGSLAHDRIPVGGIRHVLRVPLFEDEAGAMWVGTAGGLNKFDHVTGAFTHVGLSGPATNSERHVINDLRPDDEGNLWVSTEGDGLFMIDSKTGTRRAHRHNPSDRSSLASDTVYTTHQDQHGRLWVATAGGLDSEAGGTSLSTQTSMVPQQD